MAVMEFPDYQKLYTEQCKETESWRNAAELFRETLRDQFAMAALAGYMALPDESYYNPERDDCKGLSIEEWQTKLSVRQAMYVYRMADAMMEARKAR